MNSPSPRSPYPLPSKGEGSLFLSPPQREGDFLPPSPPEGRGDFIPLPPPGGEGRVRGSGAGPEEERDADPCEDDVRRRPGGAAADPPWRRTGRARSALAY